ncbi:MAG: MBL fold metallo-hydrolase [Anaerolineaceae bacterium]|nr:MBL fold metallo-hydrolase [Anaerolineaceae bacterium]
MPLEFVQFQLDPMDNNTYLVADTVSGQSAVIDPSFNSQVVLKTASLRGWTVSAIWLTHAHFDHIAGISALQECFPIPLPIGLHPDDLPLWRQSGGAHLFGLQVEPGPEPTHLFSHGEKLALGEQILEVRHTPGHTPGHVIVYSAELGAAFCGDLIFFRGVGRTDLPGSSHSLLLRSIREQVFSLPPLTRLFCGHGPETTVADELRENPFL